MVNSSIVRSSQARSELVDPDLHDVTRRAVARAQRVEQRCIVEDPLHRQLHDTGRGDELVRPIIGHQRALVHEAQVSDDVQCVGTEVPRRRSVPDRPCPRDLLDRIDRLLQRAALGVAVEHRIAFVNPPVDGDFMATRCLDDASLLGRQLQAPGRKEERRRDLFAIE